MKNRTLLMNRIGIRIAGVLLLSILFSGGVFGSETTLKEGFIRPPDSAKPWVYWYWMNGNITREGITLDLEAMRRVGVGGALILNVSHSIPEGPVDFMTKEWRAMLKHAVVEADRLGLKISIQNGDGWTGSFGPWNTVENSMQILTSSEILVTGPVRISQKLPVPPARVVVPTPNYEDIAVLAFRAPEGDIALMRESAPVVTGSHPKFDGSKVIDNKLWTGSTLPVSEPGNPQYIQIEFPESFFAQALSLRTLPGRQGHSGVVMVSDDGETYRTITRFAIPRHHIFKCILDIPLPPMTSKYWRLVFTKSDSALRPGQGMGFAEVMLHPVACIPRWGDKAGYMPGISTIQSNWSGRPDSIIRQEEVVDITQSLAPDGTLTWDVPAGNWIICRLGHTTTGKVGHPATRRGIGPECDKMSKAALDIHFNSFAKKIIEDAGELAGKTLVGIHVDSWETGPQNWTPQFREEFKKYRGYDPLPYMLSTRGYVVDSAETSERFLWDYRKTCADLFANNYIAYLAALVNEQGMVFSQECIGTISINMFQCASRVDIPMSEFWFGRYHGIPKHASSAAHVMGRKICAAEAFTAHSDYAGWRDYPSILKGIGDVEFADGINRFVIHTWVMQPWSNLVPGMTFGQNGIHFDRNTTILEQSTAWLTYLSRCQYLLQEGLFHADYCVFVGEDSPENAGRRRPEILPDGYDYDLINDEALYSATVENGYITLPSGMSYRLLVLPDRKTMTPRFARRIRELVRDGALVHGPKPEHSPSLANFPNCDEEVRRVAEEVWGVSDGQETLERPFGKGKVLWGQPLGEALARIGLPPDFEWESSSDEEVNLAWIHRRIDGADLYFIANRDAAHVSADLIFRVDGKTPELWSPDTGHIETVGIWNSEGGRTTIPLHLDPHGSVFIIFREPGTPVVTSLDRVDGKEADQGARAADIRMAPDGPELVAYQNGRYEVTTASGKKTVYVDGVPDPVVLDGPWAVTFSPNLGAPQQAVFENLVSWPEHPEEGIKYFSGSATYTKEIELPAGVIGNNRDVILDLGRVEVIAGVEVNGQDAGILWKPPFRTDITRFVKPGKNTIQVRVTNLWINRLIGDEFKPPHQKWKGKALAEWPEWLTDGEAPPETGRITFTTWRHWTKNDQLVPSGLLGPVRIMGAVKERINIPKATP